MITQELILKELDALDENELNEIYKSKPRDDLFLVDELCAMVCYAIGATDPFAKEIVGRPGFQAFPDDEEAQLQPAKQVSE